RWSRAGTSRLAGAPVADPALIRALDVGQAAYLFRGGVTYVQVSRLVTGPDALAAGPAPRAAGRPARASAGREPEDLAITGPGPAEPAAASVAAFLDIVFGPEPASAARAAPATGGGVDGA